MNGGKQAWRRPFGWLWAAYTVSTFGTWFAFDAFPLIAILVLHAGPAEVSLLAAAGLATGAAVAVPLGPWVEFQRKRPVMVAMDLTRFAALMSLPAAFALGWFSFAQLLAVSVIVAAAGIAFKAASGSYLKALVPPEDLLVANSRFESTTWTATALGPPLGGAAVGIFGPVATVVADAISYLLSAAGICAIQDQEPRPLAATRRRSAPACGSASPSPASEARPPQPTGRGPHDPACGIVGGGAAGKFGAVAPLRTDGLRLRAGDLLDGWRYILTHPGLRTLFLNTILVNGLILATAPQIAVLMLGRLGFAPWQYGLAFGAPCAGGLLGSRLAGPLVARFGQRKVLRIAGTLRACWSLGLAFICPGVAGIVLVLAVQLGLVTCAGVFNPVFTTWRLEQTGADRVARTLSAWSVSSKVIIAALTALWGLLASLTSPRLAIAAAGVLLLATPLLLLRHDFTPQPEPEPAGSLREADEAR